MSSRIIKPTDTCHIVIPYRELLMLAIGMQQVTGNGSENLRKIIEHSLCLSPDSRVLTINPRDFHNKQMEAEQEVFKEYFESERLKEKTKIIAELTIQRDEIDAKIKALEEEYDRTNY